MYLYLMALTALLLILTALTLISPSIWQGLAMLVVVALMSIYTVNHPPVK